MTRRNKQWGDVRALLETIDQTAPANRAYLFTQLASVLGQWEMHAIHEQALPYVHRHALEHEWVAWEIEEIWELTMGVYTKRFMEEALDRYVCQHPPLRDGALYVYREQELHVGLLNHMESALVKVQQLHILGHVPGQASPYNRAMSAQRFARLLRDPEHFTGFLLPSGSSSRVFYHTKKSLLRKDVLELFDAEEASERIFDSLEAYQRYRNKVIGGS